MDRSLQPTGTNALQQYLGKAEVVQATVEQLRKDLAVDADRIPIPAADEGAFEGLRTHVLVVLRSFGAEEGQRSRTAMYRVDIPEPHWRRSMARGGLDALAGEVVLRVLQKVLTRLRYAGRY